MQEMGARRPQAHAPGNSLAPLKFARQFANLRLQRGFSGGRSLGFGHRDFAQRFVTAPVERGDAGKIEMGLGVDRPQRGKL